MALHRTAFATDLDGVLAGTRLLVQSASADGSLRFVNHAWQTTLGYDEADLAAGLRAIDVVAPDERAHWLDVLARLGNGENAGHVSTTFLARSGQRIDVVGDLSVTHDANGDGLASAGIFRDVGDERREVAMRATLELRTHTLLAALTEGVIIINAAGVVHHVNAAAERILGTRRKRMIGAVLADLPWKAYDDGGELIDRNSHPILAALRSGEVQPERLLLYPRRDGSVVWIATAARPLLRADGAIDGAVSSFRDVTAEKTSGDLVRASEARYRSLFENNGTVQLLVDAASGMIQAANPAAESFYLMSSAVLVGQHVSSLSHLDAGTVTAMTTSIISGTVTVFRRRQYRSTGEPRDVEIYATPITSGGRAVLHAIVIDITARLEAEAGRRRLAAVLDQTPDVVGMFGLDGQLFYANRAGRLLMGLPAVADGEPGTAMLDIPQDAIRAGHPASDADRVLKEATVVAAEHGIWRGETRLKGNGEGSRIMAQVVQAHREPDGTLSHFSSVMHDITEIRMAEERLRDQAQELEVQTEELLQQTDELLLARDIAEQANAAKSQFLAHMSHELRTPLTAIIGFARVLEGNRKGNLSADQVLFAERVSRNAVRLLALINQLLDLSRVEAGHMEIERTSVDLAALIVDVAADLGPANGASGVQLVIDVPEHPAIIVTDEAKLRQVLVNLVANALKFTTHGCVTIALEVDRDGAPWFLTVRDTGIGIAPEHQSAVFEPFAQEDTSISRRFGGTGLGLAISKQFCAMLGLTLTMVSEVGVGSTFRIGFEARGR